MYLYSVWIGILKSDKNGNIKHKKKFKGAKHSIENFVIIIKPTSIANGKRKDKYHNTTNLRLLCKHHNSLDSQYE